LFDTKWAESLIWSLSPCQSNCLCNGFNEKGQISL